MSNSPKRILVIEDDQDIRDVLLTILQDAGYFVEVATNGQNALEVLANNSNFDLILLDLMMPVMDGVEFRERQAANDVFARIPVLYMSADGGLSTTLKDIDPDSYIRKPVGMVTLLSTIAAKLSLA